MIYYHRSSTCALGNSALGKNVHIQAKIKSSQSQSSLWLLYIEYILSDTFLGTQCVCTHTHTHTHVYIHIYTVYQTIIHIVL